MKLKSCLFILLSTGAILVPTGFAAPPQKITVVLRCLWCSPTMPPSRQTITTKSDGTFTVNIPKAGEYTITAADGPDKGKVLKTVTATKPGHVSLRLDSRIDALNSK